MGTAAIMVPQCETDRQEMKAERITAQRAELGEGPLWDAASGRLMWVDITGQAILSTDPVTGATTARTTPGPPSALTRSTRGLAVAMGQEMVLARDFTPLARLPPGSPGRMNDGKTDPQGRFWVGTASARERPDCTLWRFDETTPEAVLDGIMMSNGLGWSPDGRSMVYVDSSRRQLWRFDFDGDSGALSARRVIHEVPAPVLPDGLAVDSAGDIWLAVWGMGAVLHLSPDGDEKGRIDLPTPCPSCCAFGGEDMKTLFITTAIDESAPRDDHAGALFAVRPGVSGQESFVWRL